MFLWGSAVPQRDVSLDVTGGLCIFGKFPPTCHSRNCIRPQILTPPILLSPLSSTTRHIFHTATNPYGLLLCRYLLLKFRVANFFSGGRYLEALVDQFGEGGEMVRGGRCLTGVLTTAVPALRYGISSGQGPMMMTMRAMLKMMQRKRKPQMGWPSLGLVGIPLAPVPAP
jgi:hypothetical protein